MAISEGEERKEGTKKDDEGISSKKCEQYNAVQNVMDGWCVMNSRNR
jgi:hypothetical protein